MLKSLLPKDEIFFELFNKICINVVEGVSILRQILDSCTDNAESAQSLKTKEHETDQIVHQLMSHLHKTFVTPLNREDIHQLAVRLDDVLDLAEGAGSRIIMYRPCSIAPEAKELTQVLLESATFIKEMIGLLHTLKERERIIRLTVEIKRLEDQADIIRRHALARLFCNEKDPFELVKWKDILQYIERATDRCEDVANIVEGIVLEST